MKSKTSGEADFYESHKDDDEVWGESEGKRKPERRRLNAMVSIRLTPEEEDELRRAAKQFGLSLSAYVRKTVLKELAPTVNTSVALMQRLGSKSYARYENIKMSSYPNAGFASPHTPTWLEAV